MTDLLAIRLFEADGGLAEEWHAQDACTMNHYRKAANMTAKAIILEVLKDNGGQMAPLSLRDAVLSRGVEKRAFDAAIQSLMAWDEVGLGPRLTIALPDTLGATFNHY